MHDPLLDALDLEGDLLVAVRIRDWVVAAQNLEELAVSRAVAARAGDDAVEGPVALAEPPPGSSFAVAAARPPQPGRISRAEDGTLFQDEAEYAAMCQERAANGYNSGMGEIFRRVAAVSPVPLARPSASRQLEQAAIAGSSSSTATTSGGGSNSSGDEETPISEPEVEWSATPRPPPPTPAEEACTVE